MSGDDKRIAQQQLEDTADEDENETDNSVDEKDTFITMGIDNRPIDQGWAWMTVLACFGIMALIVGSLKSFGVLLVELTRRLDAPQSVLTSTQSVAGFFHLGLAPLANVISLRTSHRTVVIIGGIFAGVGLITMAYAPNIEWLVVTYGIIAGIGFGLTMNPALVCMTTHFKTRRSLANGLSASGSGAGAFALPNLMRFLLDEFGFEGCLLIIGGIVLNIVCFALLLRPPSFWNRQNKERFSSHNVKKQESRQQHQPLSNVNHTDYLQSDHCHTATFHSSVDCLRFKKSDEETTGKETAASHPNIFFQTNKQSQGIYSSNFSLREKGTKYKFKAEKQTHSLVFTSMESLTPVPSYSDKKHAIDTQNSKHRSAKCKNILDITLLKNPVFVIFCISLWIGIFGHHAFFSCLPSLVNEFGISDTDGAFLVSLVGLSDLVGRISSGWFSDLKYIERKRMFQLTLGLFSICNFILPHIRSFTGLCIISVVAGITTGGYAGIQLSVLSDVFGVENVSSSWGFVAFFASFALLLSPFVSGLVTDITGTWTNAFRLSGTLMLVGSLLIFLETFVSKLCSASRRIPKKS